MSQTETLISRYPLNRLKILKKTFSMGIIPLTAAIAATFAALISNPILAVLSAFSGALVLVIIYAYNIYYFNNYFYDLTKDGLVIGKGVISSWKVSLPAHKVQDVYLDQDILDRILGLYDLHFSTASGISSREAHIDGVKSEDALRLRRILMEWLTGHDDNQKETVYRPARIALLQMASTRSFGLLILFIYILGFWGAALFIGLLPFIILIAYLDYSVIRYRLKSDGVLVRAGFFIPKESMLMYRNIQDVEVEKTLADRVFGTTTLLLKTMSSSSVTNANLKMMSEDESKKAREYILESCSSHSDIIESEKSQTPQKRHAFRAPKMDALDNPYPNHFFQSAAYNMAFKLFAVGALSIFASLIMALGGYAPLIPLVLAFAAVVWGFMAVSAVLLALVNSLAYSYSVHSEFVQVSIDFISLTKRQIFFRKVQDMEKHVSFPDYFAKLATIRLETGSKEIIKQGKQERIGSASSVNEAIYALEQKDASSIQRIFASQLGISFEGMGKNPLRNSIPLGDLKPLKKTLPHAFAAIFLSAAFFISSFTILPMSASAPIMFTALAIISIGVKYLYEAYYLETYFYDINTDILLIKKGVFGYRQLTIPLSKIQSVYVDRDILDYALGLYDVYVSTVTERSVLDAHIDGLTKECAQAISDIIVERVSQKH